MKILKISILVIISVFISCTSKEQSNTYIYHPTEENLLEKDEINTILYQDNNKNDGMVNEKGEKFSARFEERSSPVEIGQLDGNTEEIFSSISQVTIVEKKLFIFDRNNLNISIFSLAGKFIKKLGSKGRGPGEMAEPIGMTVRQNFIFVADRINGILKLPLNSSDQTKPINLINNLEGFPQGICSFASSVLVKSVDGNEESNIYKRYNISNGEMLSSFGKAYKASSPIDREILSEGIFNCSIGNSVAISTNYTLPYITAYKSNGDVQWVTELDSYDPLVQRAKTNGGGMTMRWDNRDINYDEFETVLPFKNHTILQTKRFENIVENNQGKVNSEGLNTYLLHNKNGKGTYLGNNVPKIYFLNSDFIVLDNEEEYPGIKLFKL
jgi:hypothetical protein